jgi:hypothetical protein
VFARWRYDVPPVAAHLPQDAMIWTAVAPDQDERTLEGSQHGLFTYLLVGALRGWADGVERRGRDGLVTLEEAHRWVAESMGPQGVHPTLERGGSASLWDLSRGVTERAPREEPPPAAVAPTFSVEPTNDPKRAAALARMAEVRARATRDWAAVARDVAGGGPRARTALRKFLDEYGDVTVEIDGRAVVVTVEEVETARTLYDRLPGSTP